MNSHIKNISNQIEHSPPRQHLQRSADLNECANKTDQIRQALVQTQETVIRRVTIETVAIQQKDAATALDQRLQQLQQTFDNEKMTPEALDVFTNQKDDLEAEIARLERALAEIPEGPEGDEMRRKLELDLSRLRGLFGSLFGPAVERRDQVSQLEGKAKELEASLEEIDSRVRPIISPAAAPAADEKSKSKKKQKKEKTPPPADNIDQQIATLAQANADLANLKTDVDQADQKANELHTTIETIETIKIRLPQLTEECHVCPSIHTKIHNTKID